MNSEEKNCQNCHKDFTVDPEDFAFYEKVDVPPPTWCPECRMIRRFMWRNSRSLHKRTCDLCKNSMIAIYKADTPFPVYCNTCWFGDGWDAHSYEMEIDWTRPFLEQWFELWNKVPKFSRWVVGNTKNSDYTNSLINSTDCYLSYSITDSEYIMYSENIDNGAHLVDCYSAIENNQSCYYVQGSGNYNSQYLASCRACIDSFFLFDCIDCQDCYMSHNLRNKRYVFRGEQLLKETYKEALAKEAVGSYSARQRLYKEWQDMTIHKAIHRYARIVASQNSSGNFIKNAKNAKECYIVHDVENIAYCGRALNAKDCHDVYGLAEGELIYETVACSFGTYKNCFSSFSNGTQNMYYSALCQNANNLFGCVGVRKKDYCILNKQYEKEEYEVLVKKYESI